jgi:hypothetical protein
MDVLSDFKKVFDGDIGGGFIQDPAEFLRGEYDCLQGVTHKPQGSDYDRGYGARYEIEQLRAEL